MADRPITIKLFSNRATGSLARRVLYGSLALLGLPLLIHTFFLYHREYQQNVKDAFESLRYLAESRTLYLEQMIRNQKNILNALSNELPSDPEERMKFLNKEAPEYQIDQFLYIDWKDGEPLCNALTCCPCLKKHGKQNYFAFVDPTKGNDNFYVGKTLPSSAEPAAQFIIMTFSQTLLQHLAHLEDSVYSMRLSLIDESGWIFLSTETELENTQFDQSDNKISWIVYPQMANSWFFKTSSGTYLSVKLPLEGTDYTLMIDVPERSIANLQMSDYFYRIATFLVVVCFVGGAIVVLLTRRIAKPLRSLGACMQRVAEGALHVRFQPDRMGFEINVLGLQLNQMLDAMIAQTQAAERERIMRERLAEELRIGHQIQASMLPASLPELPSLEVAPGYLSAREVGGDFYDLFVLEDGRLLISIADAADKGISACLYSLSFRSMLRTAAATQSDLSSMIRVANSILMRDTAEACVFITAWIGLYDPKKQELTFCSHGHPPAYVRKASGKLLELPAGGIALGLAEVPSKIEKIILEQEDLVLLYTDGVIEAHDIDRQLYGKIRLEDVLNRAKHCSAHQLVEKLFEDIHLFCSGAPQADDLTLLALRIK